MKTIATIFLLVPALSYGQINKEIKKKSDENQQKRSSNSGSGSSGSGSGGSDNSDYSSPTYYPNYSTNTCSPGELSSGGECCIGLFGLFAEIGQANRALIKSKNLDGITRVLSTELTYNCGFIPNTSLMSFPEISATAGAFNFEARVFFNKERTLKGSEDYSTFDLQLLQFNMLTLQNFNLRFGTGMMVESYSGLLFNEHTLRIDVYNAKQRYTIGARITPDYQTSETIRAEVNGRISHDLIQKRNAKNRLYANIHGMYAVYYSTVEVWTAGVGLTYVID